MIYFMRSYSSVKIIFTHFYVLDIVSSLLEIHFDFILHTSEVTIFPYCLFLTNPHQIFHFWKLSAKYNHSHFTVLNSFNQLFFIMIKSPHVYKAWHIVKPQKYPLEPLLEHAINASPIPQFCSIIP